MKIAGRKRSMAIQITGCMAVTCSIWGTAVFADEPTTSPTTPSATTSSATGTGEVRSEAVTAPSEPGAAKTETTTLEGGVQEVTPGPLFEERKSLFSKIAEAKRSGIGVTSYLSAFAFIESMVRGGKPASAIQDRLASMNQAIDDQMKRAQVLKTQHPTPPSPSHSGSSPTVSAGGGGSALSKLDPALINSLKQKYGDKIPASISDIPPDKLLNSDQGKQLLKQLLNK
jgi:hypothetical protein